MIHLNIGFKIITSFVNNKILTIFVSKPLKININMINRLSIITFIISLLAIYSCKKETKNSGLAQPETLNIGTMRATIYGKSYTLNISKVELYASQNKNSVKIIGKDSSKTISLIFNNVDFLFTQNYNIAIIDALNQSFISASYGTNGDTASYICDGSKSKGKIEFTTITDKIIRGIFNFQAVNYNDSTKKINITGDFNTLYQTSEVAEKGTIRANVNNSFEVLNVISAYSIANGTNSSLIVEGKTSSSKDYIIFVVKDISGLVPNIYNCQTGMSTVSATFYSGKNSAEYRCDGSQSTGTISFSSVTNSNAQGTFSFSGVNLNNTSDKLNVTGEFNADLKSSTTVGADSIRTTFNGQLNGMKVIKAINYLSPNEQSIEIDATSKNNDMVSFFLQRVPVLSDDVFEFDFLNSTGSSFIRASYTINGQAFPMFSKIGQTVLYNITDKNFTGAFNFDCSDLNDSSIIYTVNNEVNTSLTTYNLSPTNTFEVVKDTLSAYLASASTINNNFTISGNDINGKTNVSIVFSNITPQEQLYQVGMQNFVKNNTVNFTYVSGSKKYVCDGNITTGQIRIESYAATQITGFYSVTVYNTSNHSDTFNLSGSFNSPIK